MKKVNINIDLTKDKADIWEQINSVDIRVKTTIWNRIKRWF